MSKIPIDTGFIVFNEENYPDLTKFFQSLKIDYRDSNMSFAVSNKSPKIEYSGKTFFSLFAKEHKPNLLAFNCSFFWIKKMFTYHICASWTTVGTQNLKSPNLVRFYSDYQNIYVIILFGSLDFQSRIALLGT